MTRLTSKVEHPMHTLQQFAGSEGIPNIADVDSDLVADIGNIGKIAAVLGNQAVNDGDPMPFLQKPTDQMAADEAEPAGDQAIHSRSSSRINKKPQVVESLLKLFCCHSC